MNQSNSFAGVHLVGSIAMDNCEQVFREVSAALGDAVPDEHTNWRDEQSAWANAAVLLDQSAT